MRRCRYVLLAGCLSIAFLIAACSQPITPPATTNGSSPRTDCPTPGAARAPIMPSLAPGTHPTIVYLPADTSGEIPPAFGRLVRYDVVTGKQSEIVRVPSAGLEPAQISADGQWILFVADTAEQQGQLRQQKLDIVRIDGRYLQTLYCLPAVPDGSQTPSYIYNPLWSPDQKHIILSAVIGNKPPILVLLDLATGNAQTELVTTDAAIQRYAPAAWLDAKHVYLTGIPAMPSPQRLLYILDTDKGANQRSSNLQPVINTSQYCWDFTNSPDGSKLFTSQCTASFPPGASDVGIQKGPSSIDVEPAAGGRAQRIYSSGTLAVAAVRAATSTSLLLVIENTGSGADISQNGLWKLNIDGSGLTRLTTERADQMSYLNTAVPWSNVSRDGKMYALQVVTMQGKGGSAVLLFGSLDGGRPTTFAENGAIIGWTIS